MIEELIEARSGSLKLTDWDTPGGTGADGSAGGSGERGAAGGGSGGEPCQFTADVRKAVTAMHNILHQQLPPEQLQVNTVGCFLVEFLFCVLSAVASCLVFLSTIGSWRPSGYGSCKQKTPSSLG